MFFSVMLLGLEASDEEGELKVLRFQGARGTTHSLARGSSAPNNQKGLKG
jgi:hypothetical protein